MASIKVVVGTKIGYADKQVVRQFISSSISSYFANTLGKEQDIVNLVMALVQLESGFNSSANHMPCPPSVSSTSNKYWNSGPIQEKLRDGVTGQELLNLQQGYRAWGLMASMGWNHVRGASPSGKCELERLRPDIATPLLVYPGDSISAIMNGPSTVENQLLAGLIMLEGKYKFQAPDLVRSGKFSDKITAAFAAYLGLGAKDVRTGITPQSYAESIMYGRSYQIANGSSGQAIASRTPQAVKTGPVTTVASGKNLGPIGC